MDCLEKNLMSIWHELDEYDKQLIKDLVLTHRPEVKPEHLGLVKRLRAVRELQIWALTDLNANRWAQAERVIVKLGGVSVWDPL